MSSLAPIQVDQLPQSIEAFVSLRDQIAQAVEGGAVMMIIALYLYSQDEALGRQCLTVAVDRSRLEEGNQGTKGWQLQRSDLRLIRSQLDRQDYIPRSYFPGATPENGYALPDAPYTFNFSDNRYSGDMEAGQYKLFVPCSGAATPRPITLQRNDKGIWKASEWSTLVVGIMNPVDPAGDNL